MYSANGQILDTWRNTNMHCVADERKIDGQMLNYFKSISTCNSISHKGQKKLLYFMLSSDMLLERTRILHLHTWYMKHKNIYTYFQVFSDVL